MFLADQMIVALDYDGLNLEQVPVIREVKSMRFCLNLLYIIL